MKTSKDLLAEVDYEALCVNYLAQCIAASGHDYEKASTSLYARKRYMELCISVADILDGKKVPPNLGLNRQDATKRLREMAADLLDIQERRRPR